MLDLLAAIVKLCIVVPIMLIYYTVAILFVSFVFIGIALVVSAPFILIIGLVLWIFF